MALSVQQQQLLLLLWQRARHFPRETLQGAGEKKIKKIQSCDRSQFYSVLSLA
jgi:hypothetical protein